MSKKNIIYICCTIAVVLIIAFAIYFIVTANKTKNINEEKITITEYDENFNVARTIEVKNKKQIKELKDICENPSLEQDDKTPNLAIRNHVKLDFGSGKYFMIQLDLPEYCYYEDANSNIKLIIKMPDGLLEKVNTILR